MSQHNWSKKAEDHEKPDVYEKLIEKGPCANQHFAVSVSVDFYFLKNFFHWRPWLTIYVYWGLGSTTDMEQIG